MPERDIRKKKNQTPERDIRFIAFSPRLVFCVKKILNDSSLSCAFDAISKIFDLLVSYLHFYVHCNTYIIRTNRYIMFFSIVGVRYCSLQYYQLIQY